MPKYRDGNSGLTPKERKFCHEYLKDLNASAAVVRAGYSPKGNHVTGSQVLARPKVQAYLSELRAKQEKRLEITSDRVLAELAYLGFSRIHDVMDTQGDGDIKRNIPDGAEAAIQAATIHTNESKNGRSRSVTVKMHDKVRPLEKLGGHLGLFNELNMALATLRQYGELEATENGEYIFRPGDSKATPPRTQDEVSGSSEDSDNQE